MSESADLLDPEMKTSPDQLLYKIQTDIPTKIPKLKSAYNILDDRKHTINMKSIIADRVAERVVYLMNFR